MVGRVACSLCKGRDHDHADRMGMWNYVLRHRLLLRAIYSRSTPILGA
jgi:hypothetical protein